MPAIRPSRALTALPAAILGALLYAGVPGPANAADPGEASQAIAPLATGEMEGLAVHDAPKPPLEVVFMDGEGGDVSLADFRGKVVLVNFWATWCGPCIKEMPALDALAGAMAGDDFAVVAISTDFGGLEKPRAFYDKTGIENLALYLDAERALARAASVPGLPVTLLLDREGREVARLIGEAKWDGEEAQAVISALVEATRPPGG